SRRRRLRRERVVSSSRGAQRPRHVPVAALHRAEGRDRRAVAGDRNDRRVDERRSAVAMRVVSRQISRHVERDRRHLDRCALLVPALQAATATWTGWITDAACAAKGNNAEHKACALRCAGRGEKLVFYNNADQKIYTLDKQDVAKEHLGYEVAVTGELDGDNI